jgi:hypothetical protein
MPTEADANRDELEKQKLDAELDRELEQTFPASDPPAITLTGSLPVGSAPWPDGRS